MLFIPFPFYDFADKLPGFSRIHAFIQMQGGSAHILRNHIAGAKNCSLFQRPHITGQLEQVRLEAASVSKLRILNTA